MIIQYCLALRQESQRKRISVLSGLILQCLIVNGAVKVWEGAGAGNGEKKPISSIAENTFRNGEPIQDEDLQNVEGIIN